MFTSILHRGENLMLNHAKCMKNAIKAAWPRRRADKLDVSAALVAAALRPSKIGGTDRPAL